MLTLSFAALSAFTVSLLHTAIPSHWLCFVAVGKAQGWRLRTVMAVAAFAGTVHVAVTVGLGLIVRAAEVHLLHDFPFENLSAFLLMGLGATYLVLHFLHVGHRHEDEPARRPLPNAVAVLSLTLFLVISPCSAAIPFLVAATSGHGWVGALLVTAVLLATTVGMMMLLIGLTSLGLDRLQFRAFDRYEKLILGFVLGGLGVAILLIPHEHGEKTGALQHLHPRCAWMRGLDAPPGR